MRSGQGKKKVAIIQHDRDLAELSRIVLTQAGYDAQIFDFEDDVTAKLSQFLQADTLVIDLMPHQGHCWTLLDRLSKDPITIHLPVLALTTNPKGSEDALTYVNVRQTILIPFDITELIDKVKAAIEGAAILPWIRPEVVPEKVLVDAATVLAEHSRDIVFRWLTRVGAAEPFNSRPDLHLPQLLDQMPLLMITAISVLRFGFTKEAVEQRQELWKAARCHAIERRAQGIPLAAVIREYQYLRDELWRELSRSLPQEDISASDIFVLGERLNYTLDCMLLLTTKTYMES